MELPMALSDGGTALCRGDQFPTGLLGLDENGVRLFLGRRKRHYTKGRVDMTTKSTLRTPGPFIVWLVVAVIFAQVLKRGIVGWPIPAEKFHFGIRLLENFLANVIGGIPILFLYLLLVAIMNVSVRSPKCCPECSEPIATFRKPANRRQALWGGWTCSKCGCEIDRRGKKVAK